MSKNCSLRLDIVPFEKRWAWRIFHRTVGKNQSLSAALPFPGAVDPAEISDSLKKAAALDSVRALREWGKSCAERLFPPALLEELVKYDSGDLLFMVPAPWAEVPFELAYCAGEFLCHRFALGTIIYTDNEHRSDCSYNAESVFLIIADPAGDIPAAYEEGLELKALANKKRRDTHLISGKDKEKITAAMENASIVHFAGHSVSGVRFGTGWQLDKEVLFDLLDMENASGSGRVPWLVFSNSCHAGNSGSDQKLAGIAGAFLRSGVAQVIGPVVAIKDRAARACASRFYEFLFRGITAGEAIAATRNALLNAKVIGTAPLLYRLYGDPCFSIAPAKKEPPATGTDDGLPPLRRWKVLFAAAVAIVICLLFLLLFIPWGGGNIIYIPVKH